MGGNNIVEVEEALSSAQPLWLGEAMSKEVDVGQVKLGVKDVKPGEKSKALFSKNFGPSSGSALDH